MRERMSLGEKMVWAAAFVHARQTLHADNPGRAIKNGQWDTDYLEGLGRAAAEAACAMVLHLRDAERSSIEAFGAGSSTAEMLRIMSGEDP